MMNPRRLSTVSTPVLRSAIFATGVVGLFAISGPDGLQTTDAAPRTDIIAASYTTNEGLDTQQELASQPGSMPNDDLGQTYLQTQPQAQVQTQVAMAEPSLAGAAAGASFDLNLPKPVVEAAPSNSPQAPPAGQTPPTEPAPVQVANANPSDVQVGVANKAVTSVEVMDECFVVEICVDRFLWALYQRTPKEDSIKQVEWRDVTIERKVKGKRKTVTISKASTKLVDQDFGWKDPKAAERVRMPMMDYVIGGMDRSFKLKLFHMLRAAETAGLSPGITSAFRDDYRQSIASGLKAASNKSYHGGSSRGGYGHGLAADIVSVQGGTRDQRWASSYKLWQWVDAHGKEFGIARPYLGRDPPHVAPTDGQEYAKHNRGTKQADSNAKKVDAKKAKRVAASNVKNAKRVAASDAKTAKRVATSDVKNAKRVAVADVKKANRLATRDLPRPAKRPKTAIASKQRAS